MGASGNLTLDFEPEVSSSFLPDEFGWYHSDRRGVICNTTMVVYTSYCSPLSDSAKQFIAKLNSFKSLEPNWDSYGALPPSEKIVDQAISFVSRADRNLLPIYFVAPGPNGELVLEFKRGNKEASAYINPDGSTELILNEGNNYILEGTLEENYKDILTFING